MSFVGRKEGREGGNDRMREQQNGAERRSERRGGEDKGGLSSLKDLLLPSMGETAEAAAACYGGSRSGRVRSSVRPFVRSFQELPTNDVVGGRGRQCIH